MTYADAGVSITAGDQLVRRIAPAARTTNRPGVLAGIGGFSALFDLATIRYKDPVLVSSTDGVGTKLKIASLMNVHDTVGIDLVAMSVNDILTQGAEPLFFLDYFACGRLDVALAERVIRGIAAGCRQAGCVLIGGETAEHPGDFPDGEYDLAGFVVGVLERKKILEPRAIAAGDVIVGLPSSGLHSNGYSLARKVLLEHAGLRLKAMLPELGRRLGEELLEPTRIYAAAVGAALKAGGIKGMAHVTGGGLCGNVPRVLPQGMRAWIDRRTWQVPAIFSLIQRSGAIAQQEMDSTFNNGIGMVLIVDKKRMPVVARSLERVREPYRVIGEMKKGRRGVSFIG
jgi:phosphoribosylformylglycinamidine cyclo-ligase